MKTVGNFKKNEFNPMVENDLPSLRNTTKKSYNPFNSISSVRKYSYVVDWQIQKEEKKDDLEQGFYPGF